MGSYGVVKKLVRRRQRRVFAARRHAERYMLTSCVRPPVRPYVHLSVRHKPALYRIEWTDRASFFGMEASFHLSQTYPSFAAVRKPKHSNFQISASKPSQNTVNNSVIFCALKIETC